MSKAKISRSITAGPKTNRSASGVGGRSGAPTGCLDRRDRSASGACSQSGYHDGPQIVFAVPDDPVRLGLVASLSRPGSNATGINFFVAELIAKRPILSGALTAKRLELLRELRPQASVACLVNPSSPEAEAQLTDIREAVHTTGKELRLLSVSNDHDLDAAFATLIRERIGGLLLANDAFFVGRREQIVALAARHAIPTMYFLREFAQSVAG